MYKYGTQAYYRECFSDVVADVGNDVIDDELLSNIINGFQEAIDSWLEYHEASAKNFSELKKEFLKPSR